MNATESVEKLALQDDGRDLNRRYELVAWGALFILFGAIDLVPAVPAGTEWLGIAIILLGLNMMRYISKIPTNIISITLGMIALVLGTSRLLHLRDTLPFFETLLIVTGIVLLVRSVAKRNSDGCCFWV
ncbi:MAG: hypothetical protein C3F06_08065 [Candidatus Methanoperedenaceae archaeon]|nr:MAG: hypothetical protein C3F06_08065 [Candidatus Methanoperedenaceae archaeon]